MPGSVARGTPYIFCFLNTLMKLLKKDVHLGLLSYKYKINNNKYLFKQFTNSIL